jgi:hypothetical protein
MPKLERLRLAAEAEAQLLELEQLEESLIMRAAGDGLEVLRRVDASPACVLRVMLVQAQVA